MVRGISQRASYTKTTFRHTRMTDHRSVYTRLTSDGFRKLGSIIMYLSFMNRTKIWAICKNKKGRARAKRKTSSLNGGQGYYADVRQTTI